MFRDSIPGSASVRLTKGARKGPHPASAPPLPLQVRYSFPNSSRDYALGHGSLYPISWLPEMFKWYDKTNNQFSRHFVILWLIVRSHDRRRTLKDSNGRYRGSSVCQGGWRS